MAACHCFQGVGKILRIPKRNRASPPASPMNINP
jgi:hypothetical protein